MGAARPVPTLNSLSAGLGAEAGAEQRQDRGFHRWCSWWVGQTAPARAGEIRARSLASWRMALVERPCGATVIASGRDAEVSSLKGCFSVRR